MLRTMFLAGAMIALAAGCYRSTGSPPASDGTSYASAHGMVPAGTTVWARVDALGLEGGQLRASTIADLRSADAEEVLIPEGTVLLGRAVASDGLREAITFHSIEMANTAHRIDADVVTDENSGVTNLVEGTKVQIRFRSPAPALSSIRGRAY
jgi:hypothetical protein